MPTTCVFQLDRLNPVYNSGEYISGRILLRTDKVKRVNGGFKVLLSSYPPGKTTISQIPSRICDSGGRGQGSVVDERQERDGQLLGPSAIFTLTHQCVR